MRAKKHQRKGMSSSLRATALVLAALVVVVVVVMALKDQTFAVLDPQGAIAQKQRDLIVIATAIMLIVIVPVFVMTFAISRKYREDNTDAKYTPEWDHNRIAETIWWGFPLAIIVALSVIIWQSSHDLDPYKPIASTTAPITIQVVALEWKWLFIYPEQNIATVNFIQFPVHTPLRFEITSDAPMNSFWIPKLGGQVYAMSGMKTQLHLMATSEGDFNGSSANLSGEGFAGMKFIARASSTEKFTTWTNGIKENDNHLSLREYNKLIVKSKDVAPMYFSSAQNGLYDTIVMKYMHPHDEMDMNEQYYE